MLAGLRIETAPDDLMARVLADAARTLPVPLPLPVQTRPQTQPVAQPVRHPADLRPRRGAGLRRRAGGTGSITGLNIRAQIGGWPAISGLAAACALGVWLGFAPPRGLPDPVDLVYLAQADIDLLEPDLIAALQTEDG